MRLRYSAIWDTMRGERNASGANRWICTAEQRGEGDIVNGARLIPRRLDLARITSLLVTGKKFSLR
jgi:hypothetical protein